MCVTIIQHGTCNQSPNPFHFGRSINLAFLADGGSLKLEISGKVCVHDLRHNLNEVHAELF